MNLWPKKPTMWMEGRQLFISVPFTWNLPELKAFLQQRSAWWTRAQIGGPAIDLMPDFIKDVANVQVFPNTDYVYGGILNKINPMATRTTVGCIQSCQFCGVGRGVIEAGGFSELPNWPDLPIICDNNLLASSQRHFDRVMDRLEHHSDVDFNQGLDARLLTDYHAQRFARLKSPAIRLACDTNESINDYADALITLIKNGVKKSWIRTYALVGFLDNPIQAWLRCELIQKDTTCLPMWFHELDALEWNAVTPKQAAMGWTHKERTRIMRRFYKAKFGGYYG
jgi:hypothetical protein